LVAYDGQRSNLEIYIIAYPLRGDTGKRPDYTRGHNHEHGQGNEPAFIQCGQAQKDDRKGDGVQKPGQCPRLLFLKGHVGSEMAETIRKLRRQGSHGRHVVAGCLD
jgi:hypothetical protein